MDGKSSLVVIAMDGSEVSLFALRSKYHYISEVGICNN